MRFGLDPVRAGPTAGFGCGVQGPAQSVGTLEEQTCCREAVVEEVAAGGGRLADPSSEMSVVATAPRSVPTARDVATTITRGFIVSPVVEASPPP